MMCAACKCNLFLKQLFITFPCVIRNLFIFYKQLRLFIMYTMVKLLCELKYYFHTYLASSLCFHRSPHFIFLLELHWGATTPLLLSVHSSITSICSFLEVRLANFEFEIFCMLIILVLILDWLILYWVTLVQSIQRKQGSILTVAMVSRLHRLHVIANIGLYITGKWLTTQWDTCIYFCYWVAYSRILPVVKYGITVCAGS